jgi:hypothetical protein
MGLFAVLLRDSDFAAGRAMFEDSAAGCAQLQGALTDAKDS